MTHWWHYLHLSLGSFLLVMAAVLFVVFDPHGPWNYAALVGFVAAGLVDLSAGAGFGIDFGSRRLAGQRLTGVGTMLIGVAMIANQVPGFARGSVISQATVGLLGGLLIVGFGVGALYRPEEFGPRIHDEPA